MKKVLFAALVFVCAFMFVSLISGTPTADARSAYLTSCMTAASNATGCHPSAAGIAGKAPTLTSTDCKSCHHHGLSGTPVVTTDKTTYASTDNILFKFTGGSQSGRSGLVIYNLAGTSEVARGVIAEDNSATLSVPASVFGAITNTAIKTAWHGNAINTTGGTSNVCTTQIPCTAHEFSAVINSPAITITGTPTCTRVAPTVTYNTTAQNVAAGGTVTYTATVTNKDSASCSNSTFAFTVASETGTAANFILPSTVSATSPNPCALAPGGTCTATLTVKAQTTATNGAADATTLRAADATNHNTLPGTGAVTTTVSAASCTRVAPTVTYNTTAQNVTAGGTVTYTATVTNKDSGTSCTNSTFALTVSAETGTALNFIVPSTLSATSPNPCTLAPGGTCTSTLTVKAQTAAKAGATDVTTVRAADATNHNTLPGTGAVTTTVAAALPKYTLTVASTNPTSGVAITASPNDTTGKGSGSTQFTLSYTSGTVVTLTAPGLASGTSGNSFQKWQKNGADYATTRQTTVTVTAATTMTAVYTNYVVMVYNDLGMHCACPGAETFLLLPPYNTLKAQVFRKGGDPSLVTSGITVAYGIVENTDAGLQADPYYSNWIAFSPKIFPGYQPVVSGKVKSISGLGLSGNMTYNSTQKSWRAEGIPAFPVVTGTSTDIATDPLGGPNRTPYLTANVTVSDTTGKVLTSTSTVVPVAFGGCCTCHLDLAGQNGYPHTTTGSFQYMGYLHSGKGTAHRIDFAKLDPTGDGVGGPVRCSWCHWDPAMGESAAPGLAAVWPNYSILAGANFVKADVRVSTLTFSAALHTFHAQSSVVLTQWDPNIAKNCYDCHPGNNVNCYRDMMSTKGVWCSDCHGDLNQRIATNQMKQPWQQSTLPSCTAPSPGVTSTFACHSNRTYPHTTPGLFGKFLNSTGHEGSVACLSCHGSPHSVAPSTLAKDNQQRINTQSFGTFPTGKDASYPIGVCNVCHSSRSNTWSMPPHGSD